MWLDLTAFLLDMRLQYVRIKRRSNLEGQQCNPVERYDIELHQG